MRRSQCRSCAGQIRLRGILPVRSRTARSGIWPSAVVKMYLRMCSSRSARPVCRLCTGTVASICSSTRPLRPRAEPRTRRDRVRLAVNTKSRNVGGNVEGDRSLIDVHDHVTVRACNGREADGGTAHQHQSDTYQCMTLPIETSVAACPWDNNATEAKIKHDAGMARFEPARTRVAQQKIRRSNLLFLFDFCLIRLGAVRVLGRAAAAHCLNMYRMPGFTEFFRRSPAQLTNHFLKAYPQVFGRGVG